MMRKGKIALIYFSRTAKKEADHKKWSRSSTKSQRINISNFLINNTFEKLQKSELEILHFDETYQHGKNFGEKLGSAFDYAFKQGFDAAISVGNDCLELDISSIEKVSAKLLLGFNAIGPTYRNGAYLIGLTKKSFDAKKFSQLSWQTKHLEVDLLKYLEDQDQDIYVLDRLRDANHLIDFTFLIKAYPWQSNLIKSLKNILAFSSLTYNFTLNILLSINLQLNVSLRAPPSRF